MGGVPPDIPGAFDPALFFLMARAAGGNPRICNGGLYCDLSPSLGGIGRWAARHDPAGDLRLEYVKSVWNARRSGTEIIHLG